MTTVSMQPKSRIGENLFGAPARCRVVAQTLGLPFLVILLTGNLGCRSRATDIPETADRPFEGTVVRVACPDDSTEKVVARYGARWSSEQGARLETVRYDPAAGPEKGPKADLWLMTPAAMPARANADQLYPVPEGVTAPGASYRWDDLLPLYRYKLLVWDRKVYALPILGDATLCFYREDLFDDQQQQAGFKKKFGRELAAPETWEQFAQIAEYFHGQKRPGIDAPCPSLPPLPENDMDLDRQFYLVAAPFVRLAVREEDRKPPPDVELFSFNYDLETGAVRIDTPGFVHALRVLQRLQAYRPPGTAPEPAMSFQKGEAVLCLAGPAWIPRFQENRNLRGKFGLCQVPGSLQVFNYRTGTPQAVAGGNRPPYLGSGGVIAVVPKTNPQPAAAFALAADLGNPKTSRDVVIEPAWGGGVFRLEHLGRLGWQAFDLDNKKTERLLETLHETAVHAQVKDPVICLRTPDERSHREALDAEIRAALTSGKDAADTLRAAADRWRKLDAGKDVRAKLAEYRLSLGLSR
jgi:multiple sugar transport system substrate-binding protein